ncbi:MAG TPA: hypothetical protein PK344_16770 [Syntrophorhabdaceae bacterium]|nr:hypothetical protein [Syntrophorhabdaceae bacterium]
MLTRKPGKIDEEKADKFIAGAPLDSRIKAATKPKTKIKTEDSKTAFLNIPISRELRNQLKATSALKGKSLQEYCTEVLQKAVS